MALYIFHLKTKEGTPLFLHSIGTDNNSLKSMESDEIFGFYGDEPRVEAFTLLKNELYKIIDKGINNSVNEQKFVFNFLISAFVFVILYLFLSLFIRDPIPMLDELLVSTLASVGLNVFLNQRQQNTQETLKWRMKLREKIDKIRFVPDPYLKQLEQIYQKFEESPDKTLNDITFDLDFLHKWNQENKTHLTDCIEHLLVHNLKINKNKLKKYMEDHKTSKVMKPSNPLIQTYKLLDSN
ncbi:hypothetical protein [Spirochaeta cellobiosiphila]|uniref:hypothetical protein n=1 Tax=Spirochaeta cellobiosiphila TaxID=504483 RepID=UPI00040231D7|nr:hypothetical protein [Spirochaeta cellobiosiphila]